MVEPPASQRPAAGTRPDPAGRTAKEMAGGSTGRARPEGPTGGRAVYGKTVRTVREGRWAGDRPLTFIASPAVTSVARSSANHPVHDIARNGRSALQPASSSAQLSA